MRDLIRWLTAPATEEVPRHQVWGVWVLRTVVGLMWLYNVAWKRPPDFGVGADNGLYKFTSFAVEHPVFPPYSWVVEHLVLPHFAPFGWMVLAAETALAVLLLTGSWVRLAAALGLAQSVAIAMSVAFAPEEWPWAYWMMIGIHLALLLTSSGRVLSVDAVRARISGPRLLAQVWGGLAVLVGGFSIITSLDDPLAARGPGLRSTDLSVSLGEFNLVGGLVVVVCGVLLLVAARGLSTAGWAVVALASFGAVTLYAQVGFSDPLLGGTATSAAFLLCLTLIGGFSARPPAESEIRAEASSLPPSR